MDEAITEAVIKRLRSWPQAAGYYLALSGGRDSCVLLDILARNKQLLPADLQLLHINHQLQAQADDWQQHCRALAAKYQLELHCQRVRVELDSGLGLEMAARRARQAAWRQLLPLGSLLLQAHHQRDQAETVLLNIMRSGQALTMPELAQYPGYGVGRPMLHVRYEQVVAYAQEQQLSWVEDPSNANTELARNYLRHELLPPLQRRWPQALKHLVDIGARNRGNVDLNEQALIALLGQLRDAETEKLKRASLQNYPSELRQALIKTFISAHELPAATGKQLGEFDRQLFIAQARRAELQLGTSYLRADRVSIWSG